MLGLVIRGLIAIGSAAIGLLAAALLLEDFSINTGSFVIAVLIFSAATFILGPLITKIALTSAPYLMGGIALVTVLVGLVVTKLLSDGIEIDGIATWIIATLVIWVFSMIGAWFLPWMLVKAALIDDLEKPTKQTTPPLT